MKTLSRVVIGDTFKAVEKEGSPVPATTGERLIGNNLEEIAPNHRARYEWAIGLLKKKVPRGGHILDAASGVGYGSKMIAEAGYRVTAVDRADESRKYQKFVFSHENVKFVQGDLFDIRGNYDAVVSIETIEHVPHEKWLPLISSMSSMLIGTVPNEAVVPFSASKHAFHLRHYTKLELIEIFSDMNWGLSDWATQYAKWENYEMRPGDDGMTLGFMALKK